MVESGDFGLLPDGRKATLFTLENTAGMRVSFTDYGGIVTRIEAPDRHGEPANVALSCPGLDDYLKGTPYFGALVGRVANRIAGARFALDGREYRLAANDGPNQLHGGLVGFDKVLWEAERIELKGAQAVRLYRRSPDGEENYPGNLDVTVRYLLDDAGDFRIDYEACADRPTPVNLTNHTYFNLTGGKRDVMGHVLSLRARRFTPSNQRLIPTGEILPVAGTPYDFTIPKPVGRDAAATVTPGGYDLNFVIERGGQAPDALVSCAELYEPESGRVMETLTNAPAVQLYTGNSLQGEVKGPGGAPWRQYYGICLETQGFPNAVNEPRFPPIILRPGELYRHTTIYRFSVR